MKRGKPISVEWDFSKHQPDVVVVNLGTNDDSYCKNDSTRQEEYKTEYVEFIKEIRQNNPNAAIICTRIMGDRLYPSC